MLDSPESAVVLGRVMADIGNAYVITVSHAGRSVSALIGPRQVEEWLANDGAGGEVGWTARELLHCLVREVMGLPA